MTEEQVTKCILQWLIKRNWNILDYDFPGGGTGRKFHLDQNSSKNFGIKIPDVIAFKNGTMLLFENKTTDTRSDYEKIKQISQNKDFILLLQKAYPDKEILSIKWGIGFSGENKFIEIASDSGVDFVVNVTNNQECKLVWGDINLL